MGWITEAIQTRDRSNISNPSNWLFDALGGGKTATGKRVNADSALNYSAVWAAVRLLSSAAASLPLITYERLDTRGKRRARTHPLYPLLSGMVNERQTSFEWVETMVAHVALRGNSYSLVERDKGARVTGLWILDPRYMRVFSLKTGEIMYLWEPPDLDPIRFVSGSGDLLHVRGFNAGDGLLGVSPITYARESIAIGLAAEEYAGKFFANATTPSAVLEHPSSLSDEAIERLRGSLDRFRSVKNAHKNLILEEGMKWNSVGISPEDAQMLESRKFGVTDVARWFGVPPHMIADLERATFSNIEQQDINFVRHSLRPWMIRIEKSIQRDLFLPRERTKFFAEFLVDALLRGDSKTRAEAYAIGRQWGWLSANDILELENRNPIDGGDEYLVPMNMIPAGASGSRSQNPGTQLLSGERRTAQEIEDAATREREVRAKRSIGLRKSVGEAMKPLFREAARAIVRAEKRELTKPISALSDGGDAAAKLGTIVERFYASDGELAKFATKTIDPAFRALGEAVAPIAIEETGGDVSKDVEPFCQSLAASFGERYAAMSRRRINELMERNRDDAAALRSSLEEQLVNWEEVRTETIAQVETVKTKSAVARLVYAAAGILTIRWVAFGENCPICDSLDGAVVGIEQVFASQGSEVGPEGGNRITPRTDITHPPIHDGCDCDIQIG